MDQRFIPEKLYNQIRAAVPTACVDVVIEHKGKALLVKRAQEPARGEWWIVGGRVFKGEKLLDAAKRKVMEETDLRCSRYRQFGTYANIFRKEGFHTISTTFVASATGRSIKLDKTSSVYKLVSSARGLNSYIRMILKESGVFNGKD